MEEILRGYHVNAETWFYLSLLLILAVFFKFGRIWSVRNLDLILLLSIAPGLLFVRSTQSGSTLGYCWLFVISGLLLFRLLFDWALTRRPRMEQNLNPAGMAFLCAAAMLFQTTKIMNDKPDAGAVQTVRNAGDLLKRQDPLTDNSPNSPVDTGAVTGPAGRLLATPVVPLTGGAEIAAARALAFLSHLAVLFGLIAVGRWHFSDTNLGLAMGTMYLLLPVTAFDVTRVNHLLPAALIVWAVAAHRQPTIAGGLLGLACGTLFFPVFLLPIWMSFYWGRGALKFGSALVLTGALLLGSLVLTSADSHSFTRQTLGSIDWSVLQFKTDDGVGFWSLYNPAYRIPVFATFLVLLISLSIWPLRKNVETLLANSAAIIVATQFWYPDHGGTYALWYLPLMLIVTFRPRLANLPSDPREHESKVSVSDSSLNLRPDALAGLPRPQIYR
jgi:hypothetical protein